MDQYLKGSLFIGMTGSVMYSVTCTLATANSQNNLFYGKDFFYGKDLMDKQGHGPDPASSAAAEGRPHAVQQLQQKTKH
jgi:hypothetical protein